MSRQSEERTRKREVQGRIQNGRWAWWAHVAGCPLRAGTVLRAGMRDQALVRSWGFLGLSQSKLIVKVGLTSPAPGQKASGRC